jgi:hypothetical protein
MTYDTKPPAPVIPRDLRTREDRLALLELAAGFVCRSSEAETKRAAALVQIVAAADKIMCGELGAENEELRALLLEKHPELKRVLKAVP